MQFPEAGHPACFALAVTAILVAEADKLTLGQEFPTLF
jgi:hypothetical protein